MTGGTIIDLNSARPQGYYARPQIANADYPRELKSRLAPHAQQLCEFLFPHGRSRGGKFYVGSFDGAPGDSCEIELEAGREGLAHDFATGEGVGDLIGLWQRVRRCRDFAETCQQLENWLGNPFKEPARPQGPRMQNDLGAPTGTWHYTDEAGRVLATVRRYDLEDGSKQFRPWDAVAAKQAMPAIRPLYNRPGIAAASHVVLVEGEKSAQALIDVGIPATTAMGGAKAPIEKTDWAPFRGKHVIVWPDADRPGFEYGQLVATHLRAIAASVAIVEPPAGAPEGWDAADAIAEGFDVRAHLGKAAAPKVRTFKTLDLDELASLRPPAFLVDGWLVQSGLALLYGAPGSLKSFAALDIALSCAYGRPWHGAKVKPCGVLYVAGEGAAGLAKRAQAWRRHHELEDAHAPFRLLPVAVNLMEPGDVQALIDTIREIVAAEKIDLGLVVIDTVARAMPGADENSAQEMGLFVVAIDRIRQEIGCTSLGVHHAGKDATKGLRGSSALLGAADTVIVAKRSEPFLILEMEKQKDAEESQPLTLKTETIYLSGSEDPLDLNPKITSLVLTETTERPAGVWADPLYSLIVTLSKTSPQIPHPKHPEIPTDTPVVHRKNLFDAAIKNNLSSAKKPEDAVRSIKRRLGQLSDNGQIGIHEEYLWVT